jgi:IS30 family transposase
MKKRISLRALARQLRLPHGTFHDEIRRGTVPMPNIFKDREVRDHSAEIAQAAIDAGNHDKGRPIKMDTTMAKLLHIEIADRHRSPCDALTHLRDRGNPDLPSERCVYGHIMPGNIFIKNRPDLYDRARFGHWEIDTVVSDVQGKSGLLVLIECKTRLYVIEELRCISRRAILRALRSAIRRGKIVKTLTITTDNGGEFLEHAAIEALVRPKGTGCLY